MPAEGLTFTVLGSVQVWHDAHVIPVSGNRRALLTLLLLNAGRVVPTPALVEGLWGLTPPVSARAQVQALVHGLRRVLRDTAGVDHVVETQHPGYLLRVPDDAVDLTVFRSYCAHARSAAGDARLADAAAEFRRALDLRHGAILGGVDAPFVAAAASGIEDEYLSAYEEWGEVALALGRHRAVVAELSELVAAHPLRERMCGQLMLALHRCGRTAEALTTYRRVRQSLVEEAGIDPGRELQRLHSAILTADPRLDLLDVPPRHARVATPPAVEPKPPGPARTRLVACLLILFALFVATSASAALPPRSAAATAASQWVPGPTWAVNPPSGVPSSFFGVTMNSVSGTMPSFRVGAVRLWDSRTRWANVEPRRDRFDWQILDRLVGGANTAELPVLFVMGGTPDWASPNGPLTPYDDDSRSSPPDDLATWDAYVRAVVHRYRGKIGAYELWNLANSARYYSGSVSTLVEMTRRASAIIRAVDPAATIVCPSMGELWQPAALGTLYRFATAGGYRYCDVAAVKLFQRDAQDPPETMVSLAAGIDATFHRAGVVKPLWNTGTTYQISLERQLSRTDADNYAARFYLVGLYLRYQRMYFYNWGGRKLPLVLQAEGGPPTKAALGVEELQRWLDGAGITSCGHGAEDGLPDHAWECQFSVRDDEDRMENAAIIWTDHGTATVPGGPGAYRVQRLDGSATRTSPADLITITGAPVMVRCHAPS